MSEIDSYVAECISVLDARVASTIDSTEKASWFLDAKTCIAEISVVLQKYNFTLDGCVQTGEILLTRGPLAGSVSVNKPACVFDVSTLSR